jgi:GntR family transcriptional regulator
MFANSGLDLVTKVMSMDYIDPEPFREELSLKKREKVMSIERVRLSEGEPYIYSVDIVPEKFFSRKPCVEDFQGSILESLEINFGHRIEYTDARIRVIEKKDFESKDPIFASITSWLMMEQVNYDQNGIPVIYSRDYHRSDKVHFYARRYRKLAS